MTADVDVIFRGRALRGRIRWRIKPIHQRDSSVVSMMMVVDVAVGGIDPELEEGVAVADFAASTEVGREQEQA